eukprot:10622347-Karenia_brevis.AAC.1
MEGPPSRAGDTEAPADDAWASWSGICGAFNISGSCSQGGSSGFVSAGRNPVPTKAAPTSSSKGK